jgi:hypothetical protein
MDHCVLDTTVCRLACFISAGSRCRRHGHVEPRGRVAGAFMTTPARRRSSYLHRAAVITGGLVKPAVTRRIAQYGMLAQREPRRHYPPFRGALASRRRCHEDYEP